MADGPVVRTLEDPIGKLDELPAMRRLFVS